MISIVKADKQDFQLLAGIGKESFIESHGNSASKADIANYVNETHHEEVCKRELSDLKNIYHFIHYDDKPAGYSKINFDFPHPIIPIKEVAKLNRIYLLKEFYDFKIGLELFRFNLELSKSNNQAGMWLFVWTENKRAVRFYEKAGF